MRAAWYEKQGPAKQVLIVGEMPDPHPAAGEVRIRIAASGINPGDIKKRQDSFGYGMPYLHIIPHSDGAGQVDELGEDVPAEWLGQSVWCFGAQSYRPFGTAAEFTVVPVHQIARPPQSVPMEQDACLGIPGITAHRAVHVAGNINGRTVLVQGAAGSVGLCGVQLARQAGALAPNGIDHIVEVAFGANIEADLDLLNMGGSVATYATNVEKPAIPFWPMVFKNTRLFFLGSDDFPKDTKISAARDLNSALEAGWSGFEIGERFPLQEIARAHEGSEHPLRPGRVVVIL